MFKYILKKLIQKERKYQITICKYDYAHDRREFDKNPRHLIDEAQAHFAWGHPIVALSLLQAQMDLENQIDKENHNV